MKDTPFATVIKWIIMKERKSLQLFNNPLLQYHLVNINQIEAKSIFGCRETLGFTNNYTSHLKMEKFEFFLFLSTLWCNHSIDQMYFLFELVSQVTDVVHGPLVSKKQHFECNVGSGQCYSHQAFGIWAVITTFSCRDSNTKLSACETNAHRLHDSIRIVWSNS